MRLSKRGEYGLRAMLALGKHTIQGGVFPRGDPLLLSGNGDVVQIRDLARREHIPIKYLEQILLALKNAGLVNSRLGVNGGYYLARPAELITLGQIFRVLDGPLAPVRCVSQMAYEPCTCPDERTCGLRMVMQDVRNAIVDILDGTTLADAVERIEQVRALLPTEGENS